MASTFPGTLDNFTDPLTTSPLNSPSHAGQHQDLNDAVEKIEQYMGLVKVIPTSVTGGTLSATGTITVGTAVSSVVVSGAFSALYDNYEIVYSIDNASNSTGVLLQLGSATTNYKRATWAFRWDNTTFTEYSASTSSFYVGATAGGIGGFGEIKLFNPFAAKQTRLLAQHCYPSSSDGWSAHSAGVQTDTTSFTAFTIIPQAGTHTGGTIRVYGYRN